ncbi:Asp-tRNA(Asn)/Glu-tRNA(Gln) amidotransferase subunit GatC [Oceanobacillus luteolus]|uniref:Aspartyl/glutamyl-tRNA(Asn/Gln) amidotransferase subunit C n=1 Tax=Oceanobacillus luteolus TaxID=1274358 RepID=A0ABW4HQA3_9BACI|nr:Asp-tRNA(Asn)/Glu-tRNA(Gln) amidotransferase subunit GatC [Oceanobacillus luteolus]MCM3739418.1 Asp-tRNA(Asn)/Glu-tRNA(Gln) amidotransferase subunit GatC [Oceanobacillus luteolus]
MGNVISKEKVMHVAELARLHITDEEAEKLTDELKSIIEHAQLLNELDTSDVEPTTHVLKLTNVMRKDEPKEWITQEEAVKNAPDQKDGQFRVPSILSE